MHYPLSDIQVDFEINMPVRYQVTAKKYFHRRKTDGRTDGRTDRQTDGQTSRTTTVGSFFEKTCDQNIHEIALFIHNLLVVACSHTP